MKALLECIGLMLLIIMISMFVQEQVCRVTVNGKPHSIEFGRHLVDRPLQPRP